MTLCSETLPYQIQEKCRPFDYHILLTHEPDTAENYLSSNYDFAVSGHSHGGQINIPFIPFLNDFALASSSLSAKYGGGMYSIGQTSNINLYVNTGIGTTHISARFGVVPEIAVFQLFLLKGKTRVPLFVAFIVCFFGAKRYMMIKLVFLLEEKI